MPAVVSGLIISASGVAAGSLAAGLIQIGVGLAFSQIQKNAANRDTARIETKSTTLGDTTGQTFILGNWATGGHLSGIRYSHRESGGAGAGTMRTTVVRLSDVPLVGSELRRVIVDGISVSLNGPVHNDYGVGTLDDQYGGKIWVKFYDGSQTVADPMMIDKYGDHSEKPWLSTHIGKETAYAIVTQKYDNELWRGDSRFRFEIIGGIPLYDISKDTTAGGTGPHRWDDRTTWEPTTNPQIIKYNVFRGIRCKGGFIYGGQTVAAEDLPADNWIPAIEACREIRETAFFDNIVNNAFDFINENFGGQTFQIQRYMFGYEVNLAAPENGGTEPAELIEYLDQACGGDTVDMGGTILTRVGLPSLPTEFITDGDIYVTQVQQEDPFPSLDGTYNAVNGTYVSLADNYEPREAIPSRDLVAEAEDGRYLPASLNLHGVPNESQAQDLIGMYLRDGRRMIRHTVTMPPEYMMLTPLDALDWTSAAHGYSGKDFEVGEIAIDPTTLSTTISMREIDPTDDAIREGDEVLVSPASITAAVYPPEITPSFAATGSSISDSGSVPRRTCGLMTWGALESDVTAIKYQVRIAATGEIVEQGQTTDLDALQHVIRGANIPNTAYEVRSRLIADRPTEWTPWTPFTVPDVRINGNDIGPSAITFTHVASDVSGAISDAQADISASQTEIANAKQRLDTAEAEILAQGGEIDAADASIASLQTAQAGLSASVNSNALALSGQSASLAELETTVSATNADYFAKDFSQGFTHWTSSTSGHPDNFAPLDSQPEFSLELDQQEQVLRVDHDGSVATVATRGVAKSYHGSRYRLTVQVRQVSGAINPNGVSMHLRRWNDDYTQFSQYVVNKTITTLGQWEEFAIERLGATDVFKNIRAMLSFTDQNVSGAVFQVRHCHLEDITDFANNRAAVEQVSTALVDVNGKLAAGYSLRVIAGDAEGRLEIVASDDPTGPAVSGVKVKADLIELDGEVVTNTVLIRGNNEVKNGSFQSGDLSGWFPHNNASQQSYINAINSGWHFGQGMRWHNNTGSEMSLSTFTGGVNPLGLSDALAAKTAYHLKQGKQHSVSITNWSDSTGSTTFKIGMYGRKFDGSNEFLFLAQTNPTGWNDIETNFTFPTDWRFCWLYVYTDNLEAGKQVFWGDLYLSEKNADVLLVDGGIVAKHIATGSVSADKLTIGGAKNLVLNSNFHQGLMHVTSVSSGAVGAGSALYINDSSWGTKARPAVALYAPADTETDGYIEAFIAPTDITGNTRVLGMPVIGGDYYDCSIRLSTHLASVHVRVIWRDVDNNFISASDVYIGTNGGTGTARKPQTWPKRGSVVQAPTNAVYAWIAVRIFATTSNTDAYLFMVEPFLGHTEQGAPLSEYSDGGVTVIDGGSITTNSITANQLAANSITAANGAIADLAVGTLQIAGGAVTRTYHTTALVSTSITSAYQNISSQVVISDVGYQTAIEFEFEIKPTAGVVGDLVTVRAVRIVNGGATAIRTFFHNVTDTTRQYIRHFCYDTDTSGGNPTYVVEAKTAGSAITVSNAALRTQQIKK